MFFVEERNIISRIYKTREDSVYWQENRKSRERGLSTGYGIKKKDGVGYSFVTDYSYDRLSEKN